MRPRRSFPDTGPPSSARPVILYACFAPPAWSTFCRCAICPTLNSYSVDSTPLATRQLSCLRHATAQKSIGLLEAIRLTAVTEVTSRTIASRYLEILDRHREGKVHEEAVD